VKDGTWQSKDQLIDPNISRVQGMSLVWRAAPGAAPKGGAKLAKGGAKWPEQLNLD